MSKAICSSHTVFINDKANSTGDYGGGMGSGGVIKNTSTENISLLVKFGSVHVASYTYLYNIHPPIHLSIICLTLFNPDQRLCGCWSQRPSGERQ